MKFPEFIIAGFGRCGTSALLLNLGQHPDVQISAPNSGTETRFWTKPLDEITKELDQYKKRFYGKISGEKTPGYCMKDSSMRYIHRYIPEVKIIICLRDPVERAISHYDLHKRWRRLDLNQVFRHQDHKLVIKEGIFVKYLKEYVFPNIPKRNIYFHVMEWAKKDLVKSLGKVYEFIGAEPFETSVDYTILEKDKHGEQHYTKLFINNSNYHIWRQRRFVKTPLEEKQKMYNFFKPYNQQLFDLLGFEIKEWSDPYVNG